MRLLRLSLLISIFSFCQADRVHAQYEQSKSPSGRHAIWNLGNTASAEAYFEIRDASGKVLFSPKNDPENSLGLGGQFGSSYADDVMWSPHEEYVIFTYYDGKYKVTNVYSFASDKLISLGHVTDGYTIPVRWVSPHTFVVEHHWPMGGKARVQTRYRESYRVRVHPFAIDSVYTTPEKRDKPFPDDE